MHNVIKEEPVEFVLILPSECEIEGETTKPNISETKRYKCETCDKSYTRKWYLTIHRKSHNVDELKFYCDFCEYKNCYKGSIKLHMTKHKTDYNHKCPDCFKFFKDTHAVHQHQKYVHSGNA